MKSQSIRIFYFLSLSLFLSFGLYAQDVETKTDSTSVSSEAIAIGDISEESEKLGQQVSKLKSALDAKNRILEIDSIVDVAGPKILQLVDSAFLNREDVTLRDLKVRKVEWTNYKSVLSEYQGVIKNRSEEISKIINDVFYDINRWELTKAELANRSESKDMEDSFNKAIVVLEEIMSIAHLRLDSVFITQKKITELVLIIDEEISNIEFAENQRRKDYFVFDSKPIWQKGEKLMIGDSIATESISSYSLIYKGVKENKTQFLDFFHLNIKTFIFQIVFLILFMAFLIIANAKWKKNILSLKNPIEIQAKTILKNPFLTTLSVGVLISAFFYDSMVPAYAEFHIMIVLFGTVLLLPKVTVKKFSGFLWLLFLVYMINTFEAFIGIKAHLVRGLLILDALIIILSLILGRKIIKANPDAFSQIIRPFKIISVFYMFLLVISIIANVIGMVALSNFITKAVIISLTFGVIIYLAIKVFTSIFILIFKFRSTTNIQTLTAMVKATHQRIRPLLNFVGLLFWLFFTLNAFELNDYLINGYNDILAIEWRVGEMTISLGGLLAFAVIFIMTLVIAKLAATLFQDEWMVNVLPRGVAPAISLVLRIVVIGLGLYAGFSAAGVDLSKLGFILGALGVGIGFGLQNVVLNFVSGLILAFERPINLGDTIEVDMEMGVVTNIGVRSSNIRAYSGAEVIIPNGDLISKKVINWTLSNRNRRSKVPMKTSPDADPERVIELFNEIALEHPNTSREPAPKTYFYGYGPDGNLNFALMYWTTFSDTLKTDSSIALAIFKALKEDGIQAPAPVRRIINEDPRQKE
ncbi:mechanosensitive ion channel [Lutimonas halocynthiae]|uniref:mechanosensitive ion channel family protein n=1 Tax=Lutimonas halocynthiae TaxID=1446477 RepID=UPI0025B4C59B|nr:mechanosensitive ion channel domain-containing protein [Lutimonas halocynthiae]MDN3641591.1 mechanosensitive ion channel [Lutimonas halocynthiae]